MIQQGSKLKVIDNSFIKTISCIRVKKRGKRPQGRPGDFFLGSVKSLRPLKTSLLRSQKHLQNRGKSKNWKKGEMARAIFVGGRKSIDRCRGLGKKAKNQSGIRFSCPHENLALILTNDSKNLSASRIRGPVAPNLRCKSLEKVFSLGAQSL